MLKLILLTLSLLTIANFSVYAKGKTYTTEANTPEHHQNLSQPSASKKIYLHKEKIVKASKYKKSTTLLLNFFLGYLGADHFYVGRTGTGILKFLTLGGVGIWNFIDFINIIIDNFHDHKGRLITQG